MKKVQFQPAGEMHDIHAKILGPLFDKMTAVRQVRHLKEGFQVDQSKFINEALEMYLNSKPNRQLFKEWLENGTTKSK